MAGYTRPPRTEEGAPRTRSRRFSQRARVSWTAWAKAGQHRMRFHTVDISARGAKLRPRGPFRAGTTVQLEFIKPDGQRLRVSAVVWREEADGIVLLFLGTVPSGFDEFGQRA